MICMSCLSMYGKLLERFVWPSVIIIVINVIVSYVHKTQIYVSKYKVFQRPIYTTARKKTCGEKQFVCRTPYDTKLHTKKLGKANN